ncbi:MAG TPA: UDP-N-acetylmuramoyl-L-alanine--D-glutamate ligase [Gaiellaceae bacterium]|jgi:UDP-N-acetylmuramoylalanine--D-glutamate ligase|nr:UDP-N-acetylmuramoyl-L-alanine--D-glutamate ligase [Gaiellaceae bacterium]
MTLPRSALVLGLARQGTAAAAALERRGVRVVRADRELGNDDDAALLDDVDVLVKTAGAPNDALLVAAARGRGIPIWSDIEVGARVLPNPILGVTGTNGKTTTTALLAQMLDAPAAGNIGLALCALDDQVPPGQWIVCELSSFQLEYVHTFQPRIAVLLNLEPDHLDRHGSFEEYRDAKLRAFANQQDADIAIVPSAFGEVPGRARQIEFSAEDPLPAEPRIPGAHNRENAAAAVAAARAAGLDEARIVKALRAFTGVPHRLELVAERDGVRFVNDSKATNVAATLRALAAYDAPLLLIAGGRGKGEGFEPLARAARGRVRRAYLIGETAGELAAALRDVPHELSDGLEPAVRAAAAEARRGEVVLLSPACASYDQFRDFEQRGDEFRRLAREVAG